MDFVLLVLKLRAIQVVILLLLWIKLTMGLLLLFFMCNFSICFSCVGGILVTNHFSLLVIDRYILAIQEIIIHQKHLRYSFWAAAIFWTALEDLAPWLQEQKVAKTTSKSLWLSNSSQKSPFLLFTVTPDMYTLYGHPRNLKFKQKYQQWGPYFQTIFPFLITMFKFKLTFQNKISASSLQRH